MLATPIAYLIHHRFRFSHTQSPNGISGSLLGSDIFTGGLTQVFEGAPLYDRKQVLGIAIERTGLLELSHTTIQPSMCQVHRLAGIGIIAATRRTFIKSHHDIGPDHPLNIHYPFGTE